MKPITEENRRQLIALARIEISRWKHPSDKQYMVDLMEIALASLTAEPVGSITSVTCINGGRTEARVYMRESGVPNKLGDIYIIPPVPVIKLPEYQKLLTHPAVKTRWNECIDEVKRLNGLGG